MVGSIDPRCETVRGTHWPKKGRVVDWSSRRGSHLGQRFKPPHQQAGHMDASDPIRPQKTLAARGPSTYGSRLLMRNCAYGRDDMLGEPHRGHLMRAQFT